MQADAAGAGGGQFLVTGHPAKTEQDAKQYRHREAQLEKAGHDVSDQGHDLAQPNAMIDHQLDQLEYSRDYQREREHSQTHCKWAQNFAYDIAIKNLGFEHDPN